MPLQLSNAMVKNRDRHRNSWQPMWWANMHPRDQSFFFWGGRGGGGCGIFCSSQCVPIKFPLSSQHAPQVPNVFPKAPHFTSLYSLFEICSLTHTIEAAWNCLVEYHNCFPMVLIMQAMKNRMESLKWLRRQNDMQGRFNADIEYLLLSFCVGRLGAFPKGRSTKECPKKYRTKFNLRFW